MIPFSAPRPLALLLMMAFAVVNLGHAASQKSIVEKIAGPRAPLTVSQARKSLVDSLNHQIAGRTVRNLKFTRHQVDFTILEKEGRTHGSVIFAEMKKLAIQSHRFSGENWVLVMSNGKDLLLGEHHVACFENKNAALLFVDAVITLKEAEFNPGYEEANSDETDFAAFTVAAKAWAGTTPKLEMSDDALTYKMVAEDAFKRKEFAVALEAYGKALERYPMWPEGHYNAALLAAEIEDYEVAAQHMRRYLVLAPDAPDAAAAKGKFLLWQHKAKE